MGNSLEKNQLPSSDNAKVRDLVAILQCAFIPRHRLAWKRAAGQIIP